MLNGMRAKSEETVLAETWQAILVCRKGTAAHIVPEAIAAAIVLSKIPINTRRVPAFGLLTKSDNATILDIDSRYCYWSTTDVKRNPRMTPQRQAVLDELRKAKDHPDAAELYRRVQASQPGLGFATVYKTLNLLARQGDILELQFGDAASHFDGNALPHSHGLCDRCSAIVDVDVDLPPETVMASVTSRGFLPTGYRIEFHGTCSRCQQNEESERRG